MYVILKIRAGIYDTKNQISNNLWNSKTYFYVSETGLNIQGINQKRFRVKVYPDALFLQIIKVYFLFMVLLDSDFSRRKGLYKMTIEMLKGKIHRATVIQAELDYVGSITVDEELLEAAGILEYEKVQIVDVNNGSRFETYTICGKRGSGMICLNGAAARCVSTGDKIIIMAYAGYEPEEARTHKPAVVFVDEENKISRVTNYEKHGLLKDMA